MLRCIVAAFFATLLLGSQARADYLAIKVDLNGVSLTPGLNQMGGAGLAGALGGPKGAQGVGDPVMLEPLWTIVYIELTPKQPPLPKVAPGQPVVVVEIDHKWGKKAFVPTTQFAPFMIPLKIQKDPLPIEFARKFNAAKKKPAQLLDLAKWAWMHGIMKEFHEAMVEVKKAASGDGELKAEFAAAAEAYKKVQDQLKTPLNDDDPALKPYLDDLRTTKGFRAYPSDKGHYTLYTNLPPGAAADQQVKRRLDRLERIMESFYSWFALQKDVPVPPMPRYRLVGVLYNLTDDFLKTNADWQNQPMLGDGFTPRRDNVMIMASKRLDYAYSVLADSMKSMEKTLVVAADEPLNGESYWRRPGINPTNSLKYAILQTMTLVRKAMEEESERATLSHEGVRQLLAASGMLPRAVSAPEWIQAGLASYFETPFGAVYGAGGLPSWSNLIAFKYQRSKGLKGREALMNTITDRYFDTARRASAEVREQRDLVSEKIRGDWERARGPAWALTYYLVESRRVKNLARYLEELAQLPRDLDLDAPTLEATFARAFDMTDAKNPQKVDLAKMQTFADEWFQQMAIYALELTDVEQNSLATREEMAKPKKKNEP